MALTASIDSDPGAIETHLREDLFHADQAMVHMGPILRHLLQNDDNSIFNDETIARVRGMLADLARQLIQALGEAAGHDDAPGWAREVGPELAAMLAGEQTLLHHLHMQAVEWQATEKLQGRLGLDPVLTPLLQDLIASPDPDIAARGMNLLASQARFGQSVRRMQMPLTELPGDLHEIALAAMHVYASADPSGAAAMAEAEIALRKARAGWASRLELLDHLTGAIAPELSRVLRLDQAGLALFLSGLASGAAIPRDAAIMCVTESQMARLALALCASGVSASGVIATFSAFHPEAHVPPSFTGVAADRATALLAQSLSGQDR